MSDPFEKFKQQLKQNNNLEDFFGDSDEDALIGEIENNVMTDSVINKETVEELNLDPKDKSFQYVFFPKNDITTYDLARILAITQLMITPDVYEKFPDDLKRHFTTFTDLKG